MPFQSFLEKKIKHNRIFVKKFKKISKQFDFNLECWHRHASYKQIKDMKNNKTFPLQVWALAKKD